MKTIQALVEKTNEKGSALPYLLGWMMGVPVSILFLIAILRSVF